MCRKIEVEIIIFFICDLHIKSFNPASEYLWLTLTVDAVKPGLLYALDSRAPPPPLPCMSVLVVFIFDLEERK